MMNPSTWSNPPPPGIDMDEESKTSNVSSARSGSVIDQIDPYIKNPDYIKYQKSLSRERSHHRRSRSRSRHRDSSKTKEKRRKHRSGSRSKRRRRSRSRSRGRRHRHYSRSSSRSHSRSSSYESRRHKHKKKRSRRYSRSRSRSRSNRYKIEKRSRRSKSPSHTLSDLNESFNDNDANDSKDEDDDPTKENAFKNDGSFLELFKKMQEEKEKAEAEKTTANTAGTSEPKPALPIFGKRRGGRVLKTGMVEKVKTNDEDELSNAQDPWSIYLKEVKKYKDACCDDDSKTRPLVK